MSATQIHHLHSVEHTIDSVAFGVEVINAGQRVETREERAENQQYLKVLDFNRQLTLVMVHSCLTRLQT